MMYRSRPTTDTSAGPDRSQLVDIRRRVCLVNEARLARLRAALSERQQIFIDTLPLLLHCNHPMLPGFVSKNTPAGLSGFKITKNQMLRGKSLSRSLNLKNLVAAKADIWGIFLMGSLGTIAQTTSSDFDIWVCYDPDLTGDACAELQLKTQGISRWAQGLGLEAHFFLMSDRAFRAGKVLSMTGESSGSAQRLLLLDEFYRTNLWLGGRLPLWWFIPADVDSKGDYSVFADTIKTQRFLPSDELLDFGSCAHIPASEFVGAGLWQLYKAIESPYKSVLKLLLLETYVNQQQLFQPLSSELKLAVYSGDTDLESLDPYIASYNRIANYLRQLGDHARLELLRRSFYFKVNKLLSRRSTGKQKSWQRLGMEALVQRWGWTPSYLAQLDSRGHWKAQDVMREREVLANVLAQSFRELNQFANEVNAPMAIAGLDFLLLHNKLSAAFARRPDKILTINPGISRDISADHLQVVTGATTAWQLRQQNQTDVLVEQPSLCGVLLWGIYNEVIVPGTWVDGAGEFSVNLIGRARNIIAQWLLPLKKPSEHSVFSSSPQVTHILLMINAHEQSDGSRPTLMQLSDKFDPFNYGPHEENRIVSVDAVARNSWGEIHYKHFSGTETIFSLLKWYWQIHAGADQMCQPQLSIEVFDHQQSASICQRLLYWLQDIVQCFGRQSGRQSRYLFALGKQLYCLQWQSDELLPLTIYSEKDLWTFLAVPSQIFHPMVIDRYCLKGHVLRVLLKHIQPGAVAVFYQYLDSGLAVIVADEQGSFLRMHLDQAPKLRSLLNLFDFIRASLQQVVKQNPLLPRVFGVVPVAFYEIQPSPQGWQLQRKSFDRDATRFDRIPVKVLVHSANGNRHSNSFDGECPYSFFCDGKLFHGNAQMDSAQALATYLVSKRNMAEPYPLFISEIEFAERDTPVQTLDYLKAKVRVEMVLNRASEQLRLDK